MDSRLDSVFRTTFRTTESADTSMGIRREDPRDDHKRKSDDDDQRQEKPQWEDDTIVSIAALKQFLITLIAPDSIYQAPAAPAVPTQATLSTQQQRAHNAASAYQATARHAAYSQAAHTAAQATTQPPQEAKNSNTLSAEENRIIHQLLHDLDLLLQEGVMSLTIQKEGSFLESLTRAARSTLDAIR